MTLKISHLDQERIREHARETYPHECCGALVGIVNDGQEKVVKEVVRFQNSYTQELAAGLDIEENGRGTLNRYVIDPKDIFLTEKQARSKSMSVIGFYHSHPDSPAVPSKYDLRVASAGYCYVIVSVPQGSPQELRCWETDLARSEFEPEEIQGD